MKTQGQEFSDNTAYILSGWVADADKDHVIVVDTTENLIRNAHRHDRGTNGGPSVVVMDHTYRWLFMPGEAFAPTLLVATYFDVAGSRQTAMPLC